MPAHELDWVCPDCGSDQVECSAWIKVNSEELVPGEGPSSDYWCPDCEDHFRGLTQRRDYRAAKAQQRPANPGSST